MPSFAGRPGPPHFDFLGIILNTSMNVINVIAPYRHLDMWVFDDTRVGLEAEPFVGGADTMIDRVTAHIPNAAEGFIMVFSQPPFPDYQFHLE